MTLTAAMLLAYQAACTESTSAATQAKASKSVSSTKASSQGDWETLVKNAQKECRVVIYGSATGDTSGKLVKAFKDKYGISLELLQGRGAEIIQKLLNERRAGIYAADAAIAGGTTFFNQIAPAGIVLPLEPLLMLDEVKNPANWRSGKIPFLDSMKTIVALAASATPCIVINKGMVKEGDFLSYNDLLDPKWKGKLVLNDPTTSGSGEEWFSFMLIVGYGQEKGVEFMKKLVSQAPVIIRDERLQVEWIAKGKYPVAIGAKPTIVESFIKAGTPIKFVTVKEGAPLTSGSLNLYTFDKAPHPNAAKLFVNWMLTREAGEIINQSSGYPTERADVSKVAFNPAVVPGPNDEVGGEDYKIAQEKTAKIAKTIFKDLLQ